MQNGKETFRIDILSCPSCKSKSASELWNECFVPCEDCGDHCGVECPICNEKFDSVWGYDKIEKENNI